MEIIDPKQKQEFESRRQQSSAVSTDSGRLVAGLVILTIGVMWMLRKMGYYLPDWLFSWQMILIVVGIFVGSRNSFVPGPWLIPVAIGTIFLVDYWLPDFSLRYYFWPIILITAGVILIFTAGSRKMFRKRRARNTGNLSDSDTIDSNVVFGSEERMMTSKNFKGGEINCVFGSTECNLSDADISGTVVLEVNQVFGNTELIVPASWTVKLESSSVMGSIEDARHFTKDKADSSKILVIKGSAVLGSITIKSY
jgi:predicted membrane protein